MLIFVWPLTTFLQDFLPTVLFLSAKANVIETGVPLHFDTHEKFINLPKGLILVLMCAQKAQSE